MKKIFAFFIIFLLITCFCGCQDINNMDTNSKPSNCDIPTFDVEYNGLIMAIKSNGFSYEEVNMYTFKNDEANSIGIIYINPDNDLDIISTQIRHSHSKVFRFLYHIQ